MAFNIALVAPTFDIVVPSTGKKIKARPFLVKENKILLTAMESSDPKEIIGATKQVLANCILDWGKENKLSALATFDFEYIFLKLRCRSKGEKVTISFRGVEESDCAECKKQKNVEIDLSTIEIKKDPAHTKKIALTNTVGIVMKYTNIEDAMEVSEKEQNAEAVFDLIVNSIESIYDTDKLFLAKDLTSEELNGFLESLTTEQFDKIQQFFETQPKLEHTIDLSCKECGRKEEYKVSGLQSFFA